MREPIGIASVRHVAERDLALAGDPPPVHEDAKGKRKKMNRLRDAVVVPDLGLSDVVSVVTGIRTRKRTKTRTAKGDAVGTETGKRPRSSRRTLRSRRSRRMITLSSRYHHLTCKLSKSLKMRTSITLKTPMEMIIIRRKLKYITLSARQPGERSLT